jgi:hypothetical protein
VSEIPAACAGLDLALVSRVLAKHYGDIPAAARELRVPTPDLRRLTWVEPSLLEEAEDRCGEVVARAWGALIEALYSDDPRRQMWASDKILSSYIARDHPLAPARRVNAPTPSRGQVAFHWGSPAATDEFERDGRTVVVPRYGGDRDDEVVRPPALIERPVEALLIAPLVEARSVLVKSPEPRLRSRTAAVDSAEAGSLWPAGIRRPSRGRRWR